MPVARHREALADAVQLLRLFLVPPLLSWHVPLPLLQPTGTPGKSPGGACVDQVTLYIRKAASFTLSAPTR